MDITDAAKSPLLTDLYQLNMIQAYLEAGETRTAVFEFSVRTMPHQRGFFVAAGLEQVLDYLENLHFRESDLQWLQQSGQFSQDLLNWLAKIRFAGDVHAMREGTIFFPHEPILRVTAPLPLAQFVESRIINILHFQTLIATKAARHVHLAAGRRLVDFGMRRAHEADAGLMAARASFLAGYDGTATVLAGKRFGIPLHGTMAHAFVEAFDQEIDAFAAYARSRPDNLVLLIDTYDTKRGARKVVKLAPKLRAEGTLIRGVRIDSGDLVELAKSVRQILDDGGLVDVQIIVSGGLDDPDIDRIVHSGAPIDGFGIGTKLTTSSDVPTIDCVYKLQEYAGIARRKRSEGKQTWPGRKQVWRRIKSNGQLAGDVLDLETAEHDGEPLVDLVIEQGQRTRPHPPLDEVRAVAADGIRSLPEELRQLVPESAYPLHIGDALQRLTEEVDERLNQKENH
ncbi:MAG: nicotinate phosphoribosyltransferase [Hyphomicrobiaceae bacterium]